MNSTFENCRYLLEDDIVLIHRIDFLESVLNNRLGGSHKNQMGSPDKISKILDMLVDSIEDTFKNETNT